MSSGSIARNIRRREMLAGLAAAGFGGAVPVARGQGVWKPPGPIKFVVPFPPGGSSDVLIRIVAPEVSKRIGQPAIVENRPGATGSMGSAHVYTSPPDGLTLLVSSPDPTSIYPHLAKTSYDPAKFIPVAGLGTTAYVVLGRPDLPAANLQELIALSKKQSLSYASAGIGSSPHLMASAFAQAARMDNLLHVPFTGVGPSLTALMGSQVDFALVVVGAATQYRSKLKFFGVSSAKRSEALPDVPTLAEQGVPLVQEAWVGVLAPPNTPAATVAALAQVIGEVVSSPEFAARVDKLAIAPLIAPQAEFSKLYVEEHRKWGEVIRAARIKLE